MVDCFMTDIPLYLLLAYRLHIMYSVYDCDELRGFITSCIDRIEKLNPKKVAVTISTFLERCVHCTCDCTLHSSM